MKICKKLIVPTIIVILTLVGQYGVNEWIQIKGKPLLSKEIIKTDLSSLPPDIRRQVPLVPITYTLQHRAGGTAQKVTIFAKMDSLVSVADVKFTAESEDHQISAPDTHTIKVDVPAIRPNGVINF